MSFRFKADRMLAMGSEALPFARNSSERAVGNATLAERARKWILSDSASHATVGTIEGPYYVPDSPQLPAEASLPMRDDEPGTRLSNCEYAPLAEIMAKQSGIPLNRLAVYPGVMATESEESIDSVDLFDHAAVHTLTASGTVYAVAPEDVPGDGPAAAR